MGIVVPFPTRPLMDEQLAARLWELVMAGQIGTPEYRRLDAELTLRRQQQVAARRQRAGLPASPRR